jgi:tetratricopeptide (TPR) repeat protein
MISGILNKTNPPQSPFTKGGFRGILVLLFLLLLLCKESLSETGNLDISEEKQYNFAISLFNEGEYYRAITEWKRFIHYFPESNLIDDATIFIGRSYFMGEKYDDAIDKFKDFRDAFPDSDLIPECLYSIGVAHLKKGEYHWARDFFKKAHSEYPNNIWADRGIIMNGWSYAKEGDFHKAGEEIKLENILDEQLRLKAEEISNEIKKSEGLHRKSPYTAGLLAAVLPGSGHFYLGRYKDGTVAFLLNASFIWGAVASFHQNNYAVGGILTFFEVGWYTGNIYSAVGAAQKHNHWEENRFREDMEKRFKSYLTGNLSSPLVSVSFLF